MSLTHGEGSLIILMCDIGVLDLWGVPPVDRQTLVKEEKATPRAPVRGTTACSSPHVAWVPIQGPQLFLQVSIGPWGW